MIYTAHYISPVGKLLLAAGDDKLIGLWMENQKYFPSSIQWPENESPEHSVLAQTRDWLDRYFAGQKPSPTELALAPEGSDFRRAVWDILCEIPYGQTRSYRDISRELAVKLGREHMSAQAVGGAVGHNPIGIIIPCHRVLGSDGSLTGYAGGLEKKRWLLRHEGLDT